MKRKYVMGGHWTSVPSDDWVAWNEGDQDITKRLELEDDSVDTIFTCHVQEHITLIENIAFFREVLRVLKKGGILRIAMPTVDKLIQFKEDEIGKHYCSVQTAHYFKNEDAALKELGLSGIDEAPMAFMFDSLFKGHNHRFVWDSKLAKKVLEKVGFSKVYIVEPGESKFDKSNCLERTIRGVNPEYVKKEFGIDKYDPETSVIEAKK